MTFLKEQCIALLSLVKAPHSLLHHNEWFPSAELGKRV
uniref:Uncharacterized protein n=1 Tax=Anguilla anguilla TaxID=7936 RepID=A0A0E9WFM8_ANGAN